MTHATTDPASTDPASTDPASTDPFRLDGRRALVTGASRGIGEAVAQALAAAGADLVLTGRARDELEAVAAGLRSSAGVRVETLVADLSDADAVETLAADAVAALGGLDILVNNAGVSFPEPVTSLTAAGWDATMAVNLRAPALLGARVGSAMAAAGGGSIVAVSSAAGLRALAEHYAYCASKAALAMATKVLALELGPHGVRANVVSPTVVLTEMASRVWGEESKAAPMLARIPLGQFAVPADVGSAVVYLCSPAARMVNGTELVLDGGFTAA